MDANELGFASAIEIAASVRAADLSPVEVVEGLLRRIERNR